MVTINIDSSIKHNHKFGFEPQSSHYIDKCYNKYLSSSIARRPNTISLMVSLISLPLPIFVFYSFYCIYIFILNCCCSMCEKIIIN